MQLLEKFYELNGSNTETLQKPSFLNIIDLGSFSYVSGFGSMFETFMTSGKLSNYSGEKSSVCKPEDAKYWSSKLCLVPFDHTFTFLPKDVCHGNLL